MSKRFKRLAGLTSAAALMMSLGAPAAFAAHDSAQPPGNPDQCQEVGFYAADEKRPEQANAPQDAGQNGTNRAADRSPAVQNGACSS